MSERDRERNETERSRGVKSVIGSDPQKKSCAKRLERRRESVRACEAA